MLWWKQTSWHSRWILKRYALKNEIQVFTKAFCIDWNCNTINLFDWVPNIILVMYILYINFMVFYLKLDFVPSTRRMQLNQCEPKKMFDNGDPSWDCVRFLSSLHFNVKKSESQNIQSLWKVSKQIMTHSHLKSY